MAALRYPDSRVFTPFLSPVALCIEFLRNFSCKNLQVCVSLSERGDSRYGSINGAGGAFAGCSERERGRGGQGLSLLGPPRPLLRLRTLRRFYRSVTHAALYAPLGVIMIIIALAIFNVLEAGNGSSYYGRSYNPPRSRYPSI